MSTYLFIDGDYLCGNFAKQMQQFYGLVPPIAFDTVKGKAERAFYYDAIDYNKSENETQADCDRRVAEREALHAYINSLPGFHVRDGRVRKSPKKRGREQKGVDVLLAVDAMEHAARGNMQLAIFITGDLDFEPLLNSLLRLGVRTQLKYVPLQTSPELRAAADEIRKITLEHFFAWSAPSFRENHKQMKIPYGERHPEPPIFDIAREGLWNGRRVLLFRPTNQSCHGCTWSAATNSQSRVTCSSTSISINSNWPSS
jgi:uncharacterized LabA/DUF88 family protein